MKISDNLQRAFLCVEVPESIRSAMEGLQGDLKAMGYKLGFSRPDLAHITLLFLGALTGVSASSFAARLERLGSTCAPFHFSVGGGGYFGSKRSPNVIWAGVDIPPGAEVLYRALSGAARDVGIPVESRLFRPHLTIARIRHPLPPGALTSIMPCINNTRFDVVPVDRVLFMNSQLNGSGPRYTTIQEIYLKGQ